MISKRKLKKLPSMPFLVLNRHFTKNIVYNCKISNSYNFIDNNYIKSIPEDKLFSGAGVFGGARTPLPTEPTERRLVRDNRKLLPAENQKIVGN